MHHKPKLLSQNFQPESFMASAHNEMELAWSESENVMIRHLIYFRIT